MKLQRRRDHPGVRCRVHRGDRKQFPSSAHLPGKDSQCTPVLCRQPCPWLHRLAANVQAQHTPNQSISTGAARVSGGTLDTGRDSRSCGFLARHPGIRSEAESDSRNEGGRSRSVPLTCRRDLSQSVPGWPPDKAGLPRPPHSHDRPGRHSAVQRTTRTLPHVIRPQC
jgi:hypothetical protein